jgi:VCBS repeat-containing protein
LSVKSHTFTQTVPATGHGHTVAQQAQGTLTFYNAAPYAQTVAAGTVLMGADGVALVTDQAASLPAANLPDVGMVTVAAQAVQTGPQGNIAPLDLNGLCCVAGVSVKNTDAFVGGQNTRDYPVVARRDVESIAGPESATLTQQAQTSLQGEIRPNEQLTSPAQCHPALHIDHPIGSEATHVTLTLSVICQAEAYDEQAVQQLASTTLDAQARSTLGTGYNVQGTIKTSVTQVATTEAAYGTLSLLVSVQGTWSYQFSSAEISQLSKQIAGLSRQEAIHLLQHDPHIQAVSITETWNATTIPSNPAHIRVKGGEKPGFPRVRPRHCFFTLCYPAMYVKVQGNRVILPTGGKGKNKHFPDIVATLAEEAALAYKEVAISRDGQGHYYASFVHEVAEERHAGEGVLALDLGIKTLATGVNEHGRFYHVGGFKGHRWYNCCTTNAHSMGRNS